MVVSGGPRLMAGVPTGYLSPLIPPPSDIVTPVGIEIEPGLGISLDGKAVLVGAGDHAEHLDIIGHLDHDPDGNGKTPPPWYPQRDFKVDRSAGHTGVDGYYDWQDYSLNKQADGSVKVDNSDERNQFVFRNTADGFETDSKFTGRHYSVHNQGHSATAKSAWDQDQGYIVTQNGNQTHIENVGYADGNIDVTRNADGSVDFKGKLLPEQFHIAPTADGWDVQGYYPQQHFAIHRS